MINAESIKNIPGNYVNKENGFFIELGANNGLEQNNTYFFLKWFVIGLVF